ncbi:hypothetical protein AVA65_07425 [Salmonella enterica subsp. enterica serovar Minnesota]|nr:hypothetical protein [Salmonella enterica subsp. enterica serovar Minnesota]
MTSPVRRKTQAQGMSGISNKYVEDNQLRDTPARLFRKILNAMGMNPPMWSKLLREYLSWVVTTKDREKAKNERIHQTGNIKSSYFQSPTLTFNKLLAGLSILQMKECEIIIRVKDKEGQVIEVSETLRVMGPPTKRPEEKTSSEQ